MLEENQTGTNTCITPFQEGYPKILISGNYNIFDEGWNGHGIYMCSGLYKSETFKLPIYVGSATKGGGLQQRIENEHISFLKRNNHPHNRPLQFGWNKHSDKEGFVWWLLENCEREEGFAREQFWLDYYRPFVDEFGGFNINHFSNRPPGTKKGTKFSEEHRKNMSLASSKRIFKTYTFLNPEGEIIETNKLNQFCKKNKLHIAAMLRLISGKAICHKGWKSADSALNTKVRKSKNKHCFFINPDGEKIEVIGFKKFCKENNLDHKAMIALEKGEREAYKNWRKWKE